ncbi:hypothetical protein T09_15801 [Trichinella sp. T9]|nr:hypothetical protein T09_15801 [Trichinella sp. T9]
MTVQTGWFLELQCLNILCTELFIVKVAFAQNSLSILLAFKLCLQCLLLLSFRLNSRALLCRVMGRWLLLFSCARITSRQHFFPSSLGNLSLSLCLYVTKNKKKKRNNQDTVENLQQFPKFLIDSSDTS